MSCSFEYWDDDGQTIWQNKKTGILEPLDGKARDRKKWRTAQLRSQQCIFDNGE